MAEIQMIDHGSANWDKIFNANFKAIGNGSTTFSDTGWIKDGITLLNGAEVYSSFAGDVPKFRIVQLGSVGILMIVGSVKNVIVPRTGIGLAIPVATFPSTLYDWFAKHPLVNHYFSNTTNVSQEAWLVNENSEVDLSMASATDTDGTKSHSFNNVFIS